MAISGQRSAVSKEERESEEMAISDQQSVKRGGNGFSSYL